MVTKSPNVPASVASGLICLALGGAGGFFARDAQMNRTPASQGMAAGMSSGGGASRGGGAPGGGGPGGGGGAAAAPNPGRDLTRLVSSLNMVEKVQSKGLTPEQKTQMMPLLDAIQKADSLPPTEATAKLDAIDKVLTADQQQVLKDMTPQRGGRGGGGGAGGGPGGGGGAPGGMMGGSGGPPGSGGGAGAQQQPDPNKPFASERNKKALEDLIANLK